MCFFFFFAFYSYAVIHLLYYLLFKQTPLLFGLSPPPSTTRFCPFPNCLLSYDLRIQFNIANAKPPPHQSIPFLPALSCTYVWVTGLPCRTPYPRSSFTYHQLLSVWWRQLSSVLWFQDFKGSLPLIIKSLNFSCGQQGQLDCDERLTVGFSDFVGLGVRSLTSALRVFWVDGSGVKGCWIWAHSLLSKALDRAGADVKTRKQGRKKVELFLLLRSGELTRWPEKWSSIRTTMIIQEIDEARLEGTQFEPYFWQKGAVLHFFGSKYQHEQSSVNPNFTYLLTNSIPQEHYGRKLMATVKVPQNSRWVISP